MPFLPPGAAIRSNAFEDFESSAGFALRCGRRRVNFSLYFSNLKSALGDLPWLKDDLHALTQGSGHGLRIEPTFVANLPELPSSVSPMRAGIDT
jgi:hypothetical protein